MEDDRFQGPFLFKDLTSISWWIEEVQGFTEEFPSNHVGKGKHPKTSTTPLKNYAAKGGEEKAASQGPGHARLLKSHMKWMPYKHHRLQSATDEEDLSKSASMKFSHNRYVCVS